MKSRKFKQLINQLLSSLTAIILVLCIFMAMGLVSMALWNYYIVELFALPEIDFWKAYGISFGTIFIIGLVKQMNKQERK